MACDMPEPCKFPSLDSCQKRFLWINKEVDLAPHPVLGVMLEVGDVEKSPHALSFKSLDHFVKVSKQGPCFTAKVEDEVDKRLSQFQSLNLCVAMMCLTLEKILTLSTTP